MNSLSLNQIAHNTLNSLRGGRTTSSEYLSLEQVKFVIKYYRALFIRRDAYRNNNKLQLFEQDLKVVELENINSAESLTHSSSHNLKRTTKRIPTPIRLKMNQGITHISTVGKFDEPIPLISTSRGYYQQFAKYTSGTPHAMFRDGYVYIENALTISAVNIRGVFEDPEQVHKFTRDNGFDLYDEDSPFPISQDMIEGITKGLISGELTMAIQTEEDTTTDKLQKEDNRGE